MRVDIAAASPADLSRVALDSPSHEDRIAGRQLCDRLTDALRGLPLRVQTVVVLARLENWTIRRIAEHLGVSERTVFNDLKLAMAHCRDAFAPGRLAVTCAWGRKARHERQGGRRAAR